MHVVRSSVRPLTLLLGATLIVTACGGPKTIEFSPSPTSPVARATATPRATLDPAAACEECWPLSGLPTAAGAATNRKPLLIKIDNAPAARPHYAITQADMVFEIIVEGASRGSRRCSRRRTPRRSVGCARPAWSIVR